MNDTVRADSDTIAQASDPGAGDAAEHFMLRLPGRTLELRPGRSGVRRLLLQ